MIEVHYVAVKVNADEFPATAQLYGIERLPTDVILTPTGKVLAKLPCPQDAGQYLAQLDGVFKNPPGGAMTPGGQLAQAPAAPVAPLNNQLRPPPMTAPQGGPAFASPGIRPATSLARRWGRGQSGQDQMGRRWVDHPMPQ